MQRAKFPSNFGDAGRAGRGEGGGDLTTILLHIFRFNEKELVLLSRWPLTFSIKCGPTEQQEDKNDKKMTFPTQRSILSIKMVFGYFSPEIPP